MSFSDFFVKTAAFVISPVRYVEKGVAQVKENIKDDVEGMVSRIITVGILIFLGTLFLVFFSVMVAVILNNALDSNFLGIALVAGFYLAAFVILFIVWRMQSEDKLFRNHAKKILHKKQLLVNQEDGR